MPAPLNGPLSGLRVIEMGQLIAVPWAMKMLADMGAQVIRLESCQRLESYRTDALYENDIEGEFWNRGGNFYEHNRNKLGITLDLSGDQGLSVLKDLISISDLFVENFTPRVVKNFGLEYQDLRKIKPDLIMVSSTGYGFTGPWANFGATGPATEGASGLAYMTGYRDGPPVMSEIPYTDYTSSEHTVFAIMAALMHRLGTGQGQFLDISQTQASAATVPEALLDFSANGRTSPRIGNEDTAMSPHGCYPCHGKDRWIVIAVETDAQWSALCGVLGQESWLQDPRFSDGLARWKNRLALDEFMNLATEKWDSRELMELLQAAGVAAGAVLDGSDLLFDPHLRARNFYEVVTHDPSTGMPPLPYASRPWKLLGTPAVQSKAAPIMGQHNKLVLMDMLGKTEDEMAKLEAAQVIGYAPANPAPVSRPSPEQQVRLGRMQRYDEDYKQRVAKTYPKL